MRMEILCSCSIYIYLVQHAETDGKTYVKCLLFSVDKSVYHKKEINRSVKKKNCIRCFQNKVNLLLPGLDTSFATSFQLNLFSQDSFQYKSLAR